jgi:hypothetical protein
MFCANVIVYTIITSIARNYKYYRLLKSTKLCTIQVFSNVNFQIHLMKIFYYIILLPKILKIQNSCEEEYTQTVVT